MKDIGRVNRVVATIDESPPQRIVTISCKTLGYLFLNDNDNHFKKDDFVTIEISKVKA
jgi:hypothetical protein